MMNLDDFRSIKELDQSLNQPKGTAFRLFKKHLNHLTEGEDFLVLYAETDEATISELKSANRLYSQSRNVVLLTHKSFDFLRAQYDEQCR